MPIEIYKLGIESIELIVKLVRKKKLSILKNAVKELRILAGLARNSKRKKKRTAKQIRATKKLVELNKRRNR
jgi:hypothetical protein|tara:strand:+ start:786 stop:1001 length:216 start_codon:yes stop_codon:yes gene_type:complete